MHPRPVEIAPKRPPPAQIWGRLHLKTGGSLGRIPVPPFLVADGGLQSNRGEPGGEERDPSDPQAPTTLDTQEEPCPTLRSCQLLTANGIAGHPLTCLLP